MQTKQELEEWYEQDDPWDYTVTPDDIYRKRFYLTVLDGLGGYFDRALDIGCLLYTSPSPRDLSTSRMPSSA